MTARLTLTAVFLLAVPSTVSDVLLATGAGAPVVTGSALAQQDGISAKEYLPLDPHVFCKRTYSYTYGTTPSFTSRIVGSLTVPYVTDPLSGALLCGFAGDPSLNAYTTEGGQLRNIFEGDHYISADCDMTTAPGSSLPESIDATGRRARSCDATAW